MNVLTEHQLFNINTFPSQIHLDPNRSKFYIELKYNDWEIVLMMYGEIDQDFVPYSEESANICIEKYPQHPIHMDLTNVTFIDTAGLKAIWHSQELFLQRNRTLTVGEYSRPVTRLLSLLNLDSVLDSNIGMAK